MRPIPAPRIGDSHGLLRAINERERIRLDEFVTDFSADDLFPPGLDNAQGRTRQFVSYARAAGLLKEERGAVELTDVGKRYVRAGDDDKPFDVSEQQAEWLRRQLREKHMTDSIFHGLAIGVSLLSSVPPGTPISTLDFGRSLGYLGRAGWDNDNTLQIQGERYLVLLRDIDLIDEERGLTAVGTTVRNELTLPVHMSMSDIAAQLNPGGAEAVRREGEAEWAQQEEPAAEPEPAAPAAAAPVAQAAEEEDEWQDVGHGAASVGAQPDEPPPPPPLAPTPAPAPDPAPAAAAPPPVPPSDIWDTAEPEDATSTYAAVQERSAAVGPAPDPAAASAAPEAPVGAAPDPQATQPPPAPAPAPAPDAGYAQTEPAGAGFTSGDPLAPARPQDAATVISTPGTPAAPPPPAATPPPAAAPAAPSPSTPAPAPAVPRGGSGFVDAATIRNVAEAQGLRLPGSVYANVAAALASGKHVVLTGPPGAGKTALALAVAQAAATSGRAAGAVLVTASARWSAADTLGRRPREDGAPARPGHVLDAAARGKWLIVDEIDRAELDRAFGPLSTFLGGLPVRGPAGDEAKPPKEWRIVATAAGDLGGASGPLLRRFAQVRVPAPADADLEAVIDAAASGDATAAAAAKRLLALRELRPMGAGVFTDAARHAAERHAIEPADERTLARETYEAYVAPLLGGLDDAAEVRRRELVERL